MPHARREVSFYKVALREPVTSEPLFDLPPGGWRNGMLVRAPNWLGDTLMCLPAMRQLRRSVPPACGLVVLCPKHLAAVWEFCPWVDSVVALGGRRTGRQATAELRRMRLGVGVVFPNSFGSALDIHGKGIPVRIGRAGRGRNSLLTHPLVAWRKGDGVGDYHQVSHYFEIAAALGPAERDCTAPFLVLPDDDRAAVQLGVDCGAPWLALAPGAAYGPAKQWDVSRFSATARWWLEQGGRVVVVGTASDRGAGERIASDVPGALDLTGKTAMVELMSVLTAARCVVANDSGAMHLAAALGTPGVAIFGSTDPVSTGPIGAPWVVVREQVDCSPCFQRTCNRRDRPLLCLRQVQIEDVCDAVEFVLTHTQSLRVARPDRTSG